MKKTIATLLFAMMFSANAQVIIGDAVGTAPANKKTSVLLEFAAGQNKGIILPYVRTMPPSVAKQVGTIVLDASTPTAARVKFYNENTAVGTNGWTDLSGQAADLTVSTVLPNFATEQLATTVESTTSTAIIGVVPDPIPNTFPDGVLVLNSTTKAMVLPTVQDVQNIPSPSPGMMVYINKTGAKRLAVFNGSKWSFWKP